MEGCIVAFDYTEQSSMGIGVIDCDLPFGWNSGFACYSLRIICASHVIYSNSLRCNSIVISGNSN